MDPATLILGGGALGLGSSLLGGLFGSKAASDTNAANREAMQMQIQQRGGDMLRNLGAILGPQFARQSYQTQFGKDAYESQFGRAAQGDLSDAERAELDRLTRERDTLRATTRPSVPGGASRSTPAQRNAQPSRLSEIEARIKQITTRDPGKVGRQTEAEFDSMFGGKSLIDSYGELLPMAQKQNAGLLSQYDADFGKALGSMDSLMSDAKQYGQDRINQVDVDAGRALQGLNRGAIASASQSGLGSGSVLNQAMRGNTQAVREQAQGQKNALGDQRLALMTGLGQQRTGMLQGNAGQRLQFGAAAADRESSLARLPKDITFNTLMSPTASPGSGVSVAPLMNMASPSAAFGTSLASFGSNMGGNLFGTGMSLATMNPEMLKKLMGGT